MESLLARDLMTTAVTTTTPRALLPELERMLSQLGVSGMPVTDSAGDLVGVVSRADVVRALSGAESDAEAIVRSGVGEIRVSCDGASQETYGMYRIGGSYDRVIRNMSLLCATRRRLRLDKPRIKYKFLVHRGNEHEIERARKIATDMGAMFEFGLLHCDDSWKSSLHPPPASPLPSPSAKAARSPEPKREGGSACRIESIRLHPQLCEWCIQPFKVMIIDWDGRVLPCCNVYGPGYEMGSLVESTLEEVWNGVRLRASREFLRNYGPKQSTGSVCERSPCPLAEKFLAQA